MKKFLKLMGVLSISLVLVAGVSYGQKGNPNPEPPGQDKDFPGAKVLDAATPNLSFPVIMTDVIQIFFQQYPVVEYDTDGTISKIDWEVYYDPESGLPIPIPVTEVIADTYNGDFLGNDGAYYYYYTIDQTTGCAVDVNSVDPNGTIIYGTPDGVIDDADRTAILMSDFFSTNPTWHDQPVYMLGTEESRDYTLPDGTTISLSLPAYDDPNLIWNTDYIDNTTAVGTTDYPSQATGGKNAWQADWMYVGELGTITVDDYTVTSDNTLPITEEGYIKVDFIDWGNPLENNVDVIVGQRFPVEVALYKQVADYTDVADNGMTIFKMACLEYPGTKVELFGNGTYTYEGESGSANTFEGAFATVLTNKFSAEVWNPDGTITKIPIEPGIGPSGKMNFASAGGGWIPTMPGWHRIWLHITDPLISLTWAVVNNDEHYIMSSGCKAQDLNPNKLELTGIIGNSTYIDVLVMLPNGKVPKSKKVK